MKHPAITIGAGVYQVHHRHSAMVARECGFFKDENLLEVDIITTNHHDDNLCREMLAGRVQFGLDAKPQSVLRWITKHGADIYLIGAYRGQFNMHIVGAKGLKSLKDLKGKRIGISTGKGDTRVGLDEAQSRTVLKSVNLDPDKDVIWVSGMNLHPVLGDPVGALRRGETDCVFVKDVESPKLEAEGYSVLVKFKDFYPEGYPDRAMISTGDFLNKHPATVTAFLKAMIRAHRFMRDMPGNFHFMVELDKRIRAVDNDPEERKADIKLTVEKLARAPLPLDARLPMKGLEVILTQEKEAGNIPMSFTLDRLVRLEFVEQANKELDAREDLKEELERVKQWVAKYGY